jgi:hypothetical protein
VVQWLLGERTGKKEKKKTALQPTAFGRGKKSADQSEYSVAIGTLNVKISGSTHRGGCVDGKKNGKPTVVL